MAQNTIELKLSEEETFEIRDRFINSYKSLETIQDYFLERKKEKITNIDQDKYTELMFNDV